MPLTPGYSKKQGDLHKLPVHGRFYTVAGMALGCAPAQTPCVARLVKSSPSNFKPDSVSIPAVCRNISPLYAHYYF